MIIEVINMIGKILELIGDMFLIIFLIIMGKYAYECYGKKGLLIYLLFWVMLIMYFILPILIKWFSS